MAEYSLHSKERLKSRKAIETLFRSGKMISSPPFRLLYQTTEKQDSPVKMTVAVPKKLVKRAVDRNLLKRRTREAYRLNKDLLLSKIKSEDSTYQLVFLYQTKGLADYQTIRSSIRFLLMKLAQREE